MPQPMESENHIVSRIQDGNIAWAPPLSGGLCTAMGVASLLRLVNPVLMHKSPGGGTVTATGSTVMEKIVPGMISAGGGIPGGSLSVVSQLSLATLEAMLKQAKGGNNGKLPTKNQWFHQVLFVKYRDRDIGGRNITSRSVRKLIRLGKIPKLPSVRR